MVISFIKKGQKEPAFYTLKICANGSITHGCPLYRGIVIEIENTLTMRQECVLRKALDCIFFVTELKPSDVIAVTFDDRIFNLKTFLRAHWGYRGE